LLLTQYLALLINYISAVQEERQRNTDKNENEVESTSNSQNDMPIERILEAELRVDPKNEDLDPHVSCLIEKKQKGLHF
jgi:retinoic acid receptor RXR-alpha